ncbi:Imm27 family immunity protein [Salinibacter ruber]|uniref:Imm27 family immunity protein n=2 Tax=Salinibacter ruber TaxID=146919 RepID=UPI00355BC611
MTDSDTTRIGGRGGDVERARRMAHAFERLAVGEEGWSALLRDPSTSALWEQTWPHSEEHGGGPIASGERERAIGLPASAGWYMDPLAKHNRSWYIGAGAASDNQAAVLFFW